ncbi:MAG TPA: hypothetical protein ENN80_14565, partial [Candidatus Hydrogenedentes bacterium]|nr:hypothetical protein [Candidatus Hydrogenedentota bacterium]
MVSYPVRKYAYNAAASLSRTRGGPAMCCRVNPVHVVVCTVLAALASFAAPAQIVIPEFGLELIVAADTNQDGRLSLSEVQAVMPFVDALLFSLVDTNGDGYLSMADLLNSPLMPFEDVIGEVVAYGDTDGDGVVTFEEIHAVYEALPEADFLLLDMNGDGVISLADAGLAPDDPEDPVVVDVVLPVDALVEYVMMLDFNGDGGVSY